MVEQKVLVRIRELLDKQAKHMTRNDDVVVSFGHFPFIAATEGTEIMITSDNKFARNINSVETSFLHYQGLNYHEMGHIIFTDFGLLKKAIDSAQKGEFFPDEPKDLDVIESLYLQKWKDDLKNKSTNLFVALVKNIFNIIEDVWMEIQMTNVFPGSCKSILFNEKLIIESSPELEGDTNSEKLLNSLLYYARSGKANWPEEWNNFMDKITPLVDKALVTNSFIGRCRLINRIIVNLYPLLCKEIEETPDTPNMPDHENENPDDDLNQNPDTQDLKGAGDSDSDDNSDDDSKNGSGNSEDKDDDSKENNSKDSKDDSKDKSNGKSKDGSKDKSENKDKTNDKSKDGSTDKSEDNSSESSEDMGDLSSFRKAVEEAVPELNDSDRIAVNKILKELREEEAAEKKEKEILDELNTVDPRTTVTRASNFKPEIDVKKHMRKFSQCFEIFKADDGEEDELLFGTELDIDNLHRRDRKCFKTMDEKDALSMAITIMVDNSGSMKGTRIEKAKEFATIVYKFSQNLNIPVAIYGHHDDGYITSFAEFDSIDKKDANRIASMRADGMTCDMLAFTFAKERILSRQEDIRLLIIIADGRPNIGSFEEHKKSISADMKELKGKGVVVMAAAIGDDKNQIKTLYGDTFVDMTNLNMMPQRMVQKIQALAGIW